MDDPSRTGERRWGPIAVIAAVVLVFAVPVGWDPTRSWFDDPWFYLQIARHVVAGDGVTFNGFVPTNGFHPLWLGFAVPIVAVAGSTGLLAARLAVAVQAALAVVAGAATWRALRRADLPYPGLTLGLAGTVFLGGGVWGSEGFLELALQTLGLAVWLRAREVRQARVWALAGALLGAAVLARLDLVFLAAAACVGALLRPAVPARERLRDTLVLGLAICAVVVPYLVANAVTTGHLVPVSGAVKSTFPRPEPADLAAKLGVVGRNALVGGLVASVLAALRRGPGGALLGVVAGGALAHVAYVALFTTPGWSTDYDYYYMTGLLALSLCAGSLFEAFTRALPSVPATGRSRLAAVLAGLLLCTGAVRTARRLAEPPPATVALARWLAANLPPDAVVFTADAPGRLAWFSERPVIAGDGLTDDWGLSGRLRTRRFDGWLDDHHVTHVITPLFDYRAPWLDNRVDGSLVQMTLVDPWTGTPVGTLPFEADDALITTLTFDPETEPVGVWVR